MKNETNIYDIDGELIRAAGDNHKITVEEAQEMMEKYRQKLQETDKDDKKAVAYATYMRNLSNYILAQYAAMSPEEFTARLQANAATTTDENTVENALNELKDELEEEPVEERKPTVMDEYVDFEEVPA